MTTFGQTTKDDPRIPIGTRVQYTEHDDPGTRSKFYRGQADGTGTVVSDDGTFYAPYRIELDEPYPNPIFPAAPDSTVLADYNDLEILP